MNNFIPPLVRTLQLGFMVCVLGALGACGGGGSGSTQTVVSLPSSAAKQSDANVAVITVESGPRNNVNIPYVAVTICVPGSANCQTIDHVLLDTGSTGLRIFSSQLTLALPQHSVNGSSNVSECAHFLSSVAWGSVKVADVGIGSKTASSIPIQIMDASTPPAVCGSAPVIAPPTNSAAGNFSPLSANGILGVSLFANDGQIYFNCASPGTSSCSFSVPNNLQVQNPVSLFKSDNNGVVVQMPAVTGGGASVAQGYLIFGVNTQTNNLLNNANIVPVNSQGYFTTTYNNRQLTTSFMDSGSNGLFFNDTSLATNCNSSAAGFYCPPSTQNLTADISVATGKATVSFSIANANGLLSGNNYVFGNLGGSLNNTSFDWGLPFFFGRSVYTVIEGKSAGSLTGPFYAFTN